MPEKYAVLFFLILLCGICIIFGGIYQEPFLIFVTKVRSITNVKMPLKAHGNNVNLKPM